MSIRDRVRLPGRHAANSPRRRLFVKYLVVLVGLVGAAVLVTSLVALYFTYRDTEAAASRRLEQQASQLARDLSSEARLASFEVQEASFEAWEATPDLPGAQPTLAALRDSYARHLGKITEYAYVDRAGRERLRVGVAGPAAVASGRDLSRDPAVRRVLEGHTRVFGPVAFPEWGAPGDGLLPIAIKEGAGGVTLAQLNTTFLIGESFYDPVGDVVAYLVDSRGRLLTHPAGSGLSGFPDLSGFPQVAAAISGAAPGPPPDERTPAPAVRPASWELTGLEGGLPYARYEAGSAEWRRHEVLSASAPVAGPGWQVIAEQRRADVLAPVHSATLRTGVFLAIFLGLAVLASALLARRMVRPIRRIESGARRIGEGALDERIELSTGDELQSLAEAFNRMAGQLGDLYGDLERRVEDRTRDLSGALEHNAALLRELEHRGRDLEAASRHKSEFLATMSHELRTPLNAIIGFSEVLRERMFGELNERQAEYLEDIHVSGRHLLALIDDILDLAKVESGRMELELGDVDVAECLETGLMMVRQRALRRGVRLEMAVDSALGPIRADGRKLKQVIFNLLSNAVRFTPEGGLVTASARGGNGEVLISVGDTGPGIAREDQERIFETFQQAGNGAGQEGSGLGLALSRAFVELHGGRLRVDSRPGEGSTFVLVLPLVPAVTSP